MYMSKINRQKTLNINGLETNGIYQTFLSTLIFFSPNLLMLLSYFREHYIIMMFYNFTIIYLLVSTMAHLKFSY